MPAHPKIPYEEQYDVLMECREAVLGRSISVTAFAAEVGIPRSLLFDWSKRHCIDLYRENPYTDRMIRNLIVYRYGPFVKNKELCPAIGYSAKHVHILRWYFGAALLAVSPWSGQMPRIIFRDMKDICLLIKEYESVYLVAKEAGYSPEELRHIFDLDTQRFVSAKMKEISDRAFQYKKTKQQEVRHAHN